MRTLTACARYRRDTYGNTYFTVRAVIDGVTVGITDRRYGHGDTAYVQAALDVARRNGVDGLPDTADLYELGRMSWRVTVDACPVARFADMHAGAGLDYGYAADRVNGKVTS